jgi:hypothetical protein
MTRQRSVAVGGNTNEVAGNAPTFPSTSKGTEGKT